ncbi:enoyl-CoA hydratase [Bacillaceae bacterium W0354]
MDSVLVNYDGIVATVTLNRPEQLNAMNEQLLKELNEKLNEVRNSDAKIVVLTGAGRAFSAGGDLNMMLKADSPDSFGEIMSSIKEIVTTFYSMPKITIAKINGAAAGLGLSLALAADYTIASTHAKIAMNFIGIGLIPDGAGHFFMEQRLGTAKAKHMIWEGKMMVATEAKEIGMIDEVAENIDEAVKLLTDKLSNAPILAMIETKRVLHSQHLPTLKSVLETETKGQLAMRQTSDHKEGVQAFLEKRKPNFKGE